MMKFDEARNKKYRSMMPKSGTEQMDEEDARMSRANAEFYRNCDDHMW